MDYCVRIFFMYFNIVIYTSKSNFKMNVHQSINLYIQSSQNNANKRSLMCKIELHSNALLNYKYH